MEETFASFLSSTLKIPTKPMMAAQSKPDSRRNVKFAARILPALLVALFLVTGCSVNAANLTVDGAQKFQTIDGMGVNINVNSWNNGELKPALDFLVTTNGSTLFRVIRDPIDWVSSESQIPALHALTPSTLQEVYETAKMRDIWNTIGYLNKKGIGGRQIILNFMGWTPGWIGGSGSYGAASYITAGKEQEFATMIASLIYYGKKMKGLDFTYLSPVNEQDLVGSCLEGPCIAPAQYTTIVHDIADELNYMGITDVRFVLPDAASKSQIYISQIMTDSTVAGLTDHFTLHKYGSSPEYPESSYPGKNYWITETSEWCSTCDSGGTGPPDEWSFATHTTDIVLGDINNGFSAVLIWEAYDSFWYHHNAFSLWGLLAYNQNTGIYTPRTRAFAYAHFNHFIGPGDVVIRSSDSISDVPTTVAIHNATTGKIAIVGRNSGNSAAVINGRLSNLPAVNSLALYETSSSSSLSRKSDVAVLDGSFTAQVSANVIFTLTNQPVTFDPGSPTVYLNLNFSGTGAGTVTGNGVRNGAAVNFSANMAMNEEFDTGTTLNLHASPAEYSLFSGWSSACSGTQDCAIMMNSDKNVTATFTKDIAHSVRIGDSQIYFSTLQAAYDAAPAGSTIKAWGTDFTENLNAITNKSVVLKGGYNSTYTNNSGYTTLHGVLTIGTGSLTVENLEIR